jgi:ribulose-phosphate 3-epimerase
MIELIPSILVESRQEFDRRLRIVEGQVATVHVDILDGTLFPHTNWFDARAVGELATTVKFELHLMVTNPLPIVAEWKKFVPSTIRALVHAEIERPLGKVLQLIRQTHGLEAGVAVNPETPLEEIHEVFHELDALLVMGVHPGASGQPFEGDYILEKIAQARRHRPDLPIEVDGGVTKTLIPTLISAGATRICAASALFSTNNPHEALQELKRLC